MPFLTAQYIYRLRTGPLYSKVFQMSNFFDGIFCLNCINENLSNLLKHHFIFDFFVFGNKDDEENDVGGEAEN